MKQKKIYLLVISVFSLGILSASCKKNNDAYSESGNSQNVDTLSKKDSVDAAIFVITDFGAVGDGKTLNTEAIQKAIDSAAAVQGTAVIPKGDFLCGPLTLHSNMTLELQSGAVLRLRNDIADYPVANNRYLNFLNADKISNIKITGDGTVDGQGQPWWQAYDAGTLVPRRPQLIYMEDCSNIEISDIHTLNPPNTHFSLKACTNVVFDNVTITAPANSHNTDGINISATHVLIKDCNIQTGDDNIAINTGSFASGDIIVKNCHFGYGHGLSIGSYTSGGLDSLTVDSCTFDGTTSGIRMKSNRDRGGLVQHLSYSHITMNDIQYPIFISSYYPHEPKNPEDDPIQAVTATTPQWKNIQLNGISIKNSENALIIWGVPEGGIDSIKLSDVTIEADKGMIINNAQNIVFDKCTVTVKSGDKLKTYNADVTGL